MVAGFDADHFRCAVILVLQLNTSLGQFIFPGIQSSFRFRPLREAPFLPVLSNRSENVRSETPRVFGGGVLVNNEQVAGPPCVTFTGIRGDCRTLNKCARFVSEVAILIASPCILQGNHRGVCCPHVLVQRRPRIPLNRPKNLLVSPPEPFVIIPKIEAQDIDNALSAAETTRVKQNRQDLRLKQKGIFPKKGSQAAKSQRFKAANRISPNIGKKAFLNLEASKQLSQKFGLSSDQGRFALPKFSAIGSKLGDGCALPPTTCIPGYPYRTMDGSCNNLNETSWGKSNFPLQRILPPAYEDGISAPRMTGLPTSREVSEAMTSSEDKPDRKHTLMLMQWGQFVDHDITHTPTVKGVDDTDILCCGDNGQRLPNDLLHRECLPIDIMGHDRFYSKFRQRCMEFVRSMPAPREQCKFGPREQVNQITAWLDGSNVYGSDFDESVHLRELRRGRMKVTKIQGRDMLPLNPDDCADETNRRFCFAAGDLRCNEQMDLTITHTLWMREHNRVAAELEKLNPSWDDERLYQEARRIVIAELQHITYKEWLPIILGKQYIQKWSLEPKTSGYTDNYNNAIDPTITNVFATAAFRFGHSLVQDHLEGFNLFGSKIRNMSLTETQFEPFELYNNQTLERFVRGLTTQKSQRMDPSFAPDLTKHLFKEHEELFGMDLVALNIQRGRDHGIPPYMQWRKLCGLKEFSSWKELSTLFPSTVVARLQSLYKSIDDIDVFVGGIHEESEDDGILGPTFQCIVGDQFTRLKSGDRFWYENADNGFSSSQLQQIRKVSLARILCDNAEGMVQMQKDVFQEVHVDNRRFSCGSDDIPSMQLSFWRE
eukprot:TRINITY_DN29621_c0_g1_i3.p1 TRINITY_DN29621_c0_g1~~TRINITY_DN29621_c0_g1_i3.p1  ORF type:complete len:828 (-),score=123.74 TRINITY_DN29621_c0_g1_i3:220-2703(-)